MDLMDALDFVGGSIGKNSVIEALSYTRISGGRILATDTELAACCPVEGGFDLDATPEHGTFRHALRRASKDLEMSLTPKGQLAVKGKGFRAYVPCVDENEFFDSIEPQGDAMPVDGKAMLAAMRAVRPFIGTDATRKWSQGVNLRDQSLMATNNVIMCEHYTATAFPTPMILPVRAVDELLRIETPPVSVRCDGNSATFLYPTEGCWLRSSLIGEQWPAGVRDIFRPLDGCVPIPAGFFDAVEGLKPFAGQADQVWCEGGHLKTSTAEGEGAQFAVDGLDPEVRFACGIGMLASLKGLASHMHFDWPNPMAWKNADGTARGVFAGMNW